MLSITGPVCDPFVFDYVPDGDTWDATDHLGGVDQVIDVDVSIRPARSDGDPIPDIDDGVPVAQWLPGAERLGLRPGRSPGDDVEIPDVGYPATEKERTAPEKCPVSIRQVEGQQIPYQLRMHT